MLLADPLTTVPPEELITELARQAAAGSPYLTAVRQLSAAERGQRHGLA